MEGVFLWNAADLCAEIWESLGSEGGYQLKMGLNGQYYLAGPETDSDGYFDMVVLLSSATAEDLDTITISPGQMDWRKEGYEIEPAE